MTFCQAKMRICTRLLLTGAAGTLPRSASSVSKYLTCHGGCKIYETVKSLLSLTVPAARTRLFVPRPGCRGAAASLACLPALRGSPPGKDPSHQHRSPPLHSVSQLWTRGGGHPFPVPFKIILGIFLLFYFLFSFMKKNKKLNYRFVFQHVTSFMF